jgi:hypothetical protein
MHLEKPYYCGNEEEATRARLLMESDLSNGGFEAISDGKEVIGDGLVLEVVADELRMADEPKELAASCVEGGLEPGFHRLNTPTAYIARRIGRVLKLNRIDEGWFKEIGGAVKAVRTFTDHTVVN